MVFKGQSIYFDECVKSVHNVGVGSGARICELVKSDFYLCAVIRVISLVEKIDLTYGFTGLVFLCECHC